MCRFMRGEREAAMAAFNSRAVNSTGSIVPPTPGTPSTMFANARTNPMIYQRMQSSDSDKDGAGSTNGPTSIGSCRGSD